jgi:hypothetical protein
MEQLWRLVLEVESDLQATCCEQSESVACPHLHFGPTTGLPRHTADLPHRRRTDAQSLSLSLSLAYPISTAVAAREHDTVVLLLY